MLTRFLVFLIILLSIVATAAISTIYVRSTEEKIGGVKTEDLEGVVASFIRSNPNVVVDAFTNARKLQEQAQAKAAEKNISSKRDELENDANTPFVGNKNGDVVIVKFSDYNCGYCKRVLPDMIQLLKEDKNVKIVFKDFPILGSASHNNAKAAIAAFKIAPEKYFELHKAMLKGSARTEAQIFAMATKVGIDAEALKAEMKKPVYDGQIQKNLALGKAIGVRGTPAFVIGGEFVRGAASLAAMKQHIRTARAKK